MQLVIYPDKRLRAHNRPLFRNDIGRELKRKAEEMLKIAKEHDGAAIAAPQVGINQRFFVVVDLKQLPHDIIINPNWGPAHDSETYMANEGCLSFPGLFIEKERFDRINVCYKCIRGKIWSMELSGFAAHVFQHETDHLDGELMIDHFTKAFRKECENEVR